jgi:histidyl-tRNA synthetase
MLDLLDDFGLLPDGKGQRLDVFVIDADPEQFQRVVGTVGDLRHRGVRAEFSYRRQSIGKQLKAASASGCKAAVLLGQETRDREVVTIKDLATGEQREVPIAQFLSDPWSVLPGEGQA